MVRGNATSTNFSFTYFRFELHSFTLDTELLKSMDNDRKWKSLQPIRRKKIGLSNAINAPILIGSSIWIAPSKNGPLVEYHCDSDSIGSLISYPHEFGLASCTSCKYKEDSIVLMNHCEILVFDTKTRTLSEVTRLPDLRPGNQTIDASASCVCIGNYIHIMDGFQRNNGRYLVYSVADQTVRTFEEPPRYTTGYVPILKPNDSYKSSDKMLISGFARKQTGRDIPSVIVDLIGKSSIFELFKFGGSKYTNGTRESKVCDNDPFYVGSLKRVEGKNDAQPILTVETGTGVRVETSTDRIRIHSARFIYRDIWWSV